MHVGCFEGGAGQCRIIQQTSPTPPTPTPNSAKTRAHSFRHQRQKCVEGGESIDYQPLHWMASVELSQRVWAVQSFPIYTLLSLSLSLTGCLSEQEKQKKRWTLKQTLTEMAPKTHFKANTTRRYCSSRIFLVGNVCAGITFNLMAKFGVINTYTRSLFFINRHIDHGS